MYSSNIAPLAPSSEEMERRATRSARATIVGVVGFSAAALYSYSQGVSLVGCGIVLAGTFASGVVGVRSIDRSYDPGSYSHTLPETIDASSQVSLSASNSNR